MLRVKCPKCGLGRNWNPSTIKGKSIRCFHCGKYFTPYSNINKHVQIVGDNID